MLKISFPIISLLLLAVIFLQASEYVFSQSLLDTEVVPPTNLEQISTTQATLATESGQLSPTPTPPPPVNPINLTLSPVFLQLETNPGQATTSEIKIRNNGAEDEFLQISYATFSYNETTQQIDLNSQATEEHLQWVSVDTPTFVVRPSEWSTIKMTFAPPLEASLGYYYAVIFNRVSEPIVGGTTKVTGAPAVLVLAEVFSPLAKRELQLDSFTVPKVWIEFLPQTFLLNIRNTGNVHIPPTGNIFIDSASQKDLAVLSVNPANSLILPNTSRQFTVIWDDGFPKYVTQTENGQTVLDESGEPVQKLEWNFAEADKFRIGKYTAHLLLVYDNGERDVPIESFVSFWVIPWRITAALIVVTLFFLVGITASVVIVVRSLKRRSTPA